MLAFLVAFLIVPMLIPTIARRLGVWVFPISALLPGAAFVHTALQWPAIAAGNARAESVAWIPQLHLSITVRLDVLSWLLALIVTGVGALVAGYARLRSWAPTRLQQMDEIAARLSAPSEDAARGTPELPR